VVPARARAPARCVGQQRGMASEGAVVRRGTPDEADMLTQVVYEPQNDGWLRSVERVKLFRRSKTAQEQIEKRKQWRRFGACAGAVGPERGVTMVAVDVTLIEDPLGEDASKTGEELMIERLKATVKSKGTHRPESAADYEAFAASQPQRAGSNSRYTRGGAGSGQSPGRFGGQRAPSAPSAGGRSNSPVFGRAGSDARGDSRSDARGGGGQRSPANWGRGPSPSRRDGRHTPPRDAAH
jgi:hypothetical protein